jgi:site-specific recombinase XerD
VGQRFGGETPPQDISRSLLAEFLASCGAEGRSEQSLIGLRTRVPKLFAYLQESGLDLRALRAKEAQGYLSWLSSGKTRSGSSYCGRTVAAYVSAAAAFCHFLRRRGVLASNPFTEIKRARAEKRLPRGILKEAEMGRLLEKLARFDECGYLKAAIYRYRTHVAGELQYATGMRVSEVAALAVEDIDFARSLVHVRGGKGGYDRTAYLGEYTREVLRLYVERVRGKLFNLWNERNGQLLFGTGWAWFGHIINAELKKACLAAELPPMRSHGFRHAMGTHLLHAGCSIRHIQSLLGHRHLKNTEVYTKVEKEDLKEVVDRCHPRKWKGPDRA